MRWDAQRYLGRHGFIIERGQALVDLLDPQAGEPTVCYGSRAVSHRLRERPFKQSTLQRPQPARHRPFKCANVTGSKGRIAAALLLYAGRPIA